MLRLTDRRQIRAILETDRPWAVYALADLEPGLFEHAHWYCPASDEPALGLFYSGFAIPVLITLALTIGACTSIFTVVDHVLLRPLPLPYADRLVRLYEVNPTARRPKTKCFEGFRSHGR